MELWKDINNYEGLYQISNLGRIKDLNNNIFRKIQQRPDNYCYINLRKNNKYKNYYIHRLVALHFITCINNTLEVNHKDGDKTNNIVTNLEWVTKSENIKHSYRILGQLPNKPFLGKKGKDMPTSKRIIQYDLSNIEINRFDSITIASEETKVNRRCISYACNGKYKTSGRYKWKYE